jgi:hypothetical protein
MPANSSLEPWKCTPAQIAGPAAGSQLGHPGRIPPRTPRQEHGTCGGTFGGLRPWKVTPAKCAGPHGTIFD